MEVGEPFADFGILFKVGKWVVDFNFGYCRIQMEVDALNVDFTLFIVDNGNVDFRTVQALFKVDIWFADFKFFFGPYRKFGSR